MKTTVLVFHPQYFASRVNARLAKAAQKLEGVEVRFLYDLYPDFKIDIDEEQTACESADRIVFQFPMYWYSSPSLLKEWQDTVLTYGWAYGSGGTALHGKELGLAVSPGINAAHYELLTGDYRDDIHNLLRPFKKMSDQVGLRLIEPFITIGAVSMPEAELTKQVARYPRWLLGEVPELDVVG